MATSEFRRLSQRLTLFDVYVVSTGAMIAGLFLLPGVAASHTGTSVVLAYLVSGLLIVPALLSKAELATAMPRAGGTYFYLDRTLGPLVGTIGGIGVWLTLILKSAFALIGMGAYLALIVDVPIVATAIGLTAVFAVVNTAGARESTGVVRWLVFVSLVVLGLFVLHGIVAAADSAGDRLAREPFLSHGFDGFVETVGLVFVSYIGLTKVASLAEEIRDPERNIPMGMGLALATVLLLYVGAVGVMVAVLPLDALSASLTPAADATVAFVSWIPPQAAEGLIVAAAIAAFAAMANAGILAASRFPLAMARDGLAPKVFTRTSAWGTPVPAILLSCAIVVVSLLTLDVEGVAKLAGALQLLIFALINVAVIVMRESRIESYDPGFRSPLYPWMQLAGLFVPLILVAEMGWLAVAFTFGVIMVSVAWYTYYGRRKILREGAIFHVFERLGRRRFAGLDRELRDIMKEKGARADDPFDHVVAHARVIDCPEECDLTDLVHQASALLALELPVSAPDLEEAFGRGLRAGATPVSHGAALLHTRLPTIDDSVMVIARCRHGVRVSSTDAESELVRQAASTPIRAVFFLVSGEADPGRHLRILAQIAGRVDDDAFMPEWLANADEQDLKETLLRDDRFLSLTLRSGTRSEALIGKALRDVAMPEGALIAVIRRRGVSIVPRGNTVLMEHDRLTIIGEPAGVAELAHRYGEPARLT